MSKLTLQSPELIDYLAGVLGARVEYHATTNYLADVGVNASIAEKLIRVYSTETYQPRTGETKGATREQIHSFIAVQDFTTKALGDVKAGDVLKPATWKAPAKHARGNIFDSTGIDNVNHYGPEYLR